MISERHVKEFCCEDISLIENYNLAIADTTQTWECHHILGEIFSRKYLKDNNLYENRPAYELRFMTKLDHSRLHKKGKPTWNKGKQLSEETKTAISAALKGKPLSEATKAAISIAKKGKPTWNKGKTLGPLSDKHKAAISAGLQGKKAKKVLQFTKSGEFVREWQSAYEAQRELGITQSNICDCCNGNRKSAGGYIWRYAE